MTTIMYDGQDLHITNTNTTRTLAPAQFFAMFTDCDLTDVAAQAMECKGDRVIVPSTSKARGLRPRHATVLGIPQ